ncbi:MFS transporter [Sphingomonas sp. 37zxx]|uniref:MFS transporter n=1 Tax=Sphingomonas sp. 37zxx TaxID=1550073 RepID=UPI000ACDA31D|nr:MFS transporter [Sphingomonas sp. 37zxx]
MPIMTAAVPGRPGIPRLLLFSSGDFAFNLYWQSVTLYLLFFYTDTLGLPPAIAGLVYMAGAIWDGVADLIVGIAAERSRRSYRRFVVLGAVPLGLTFPLLYLLPPFDGAPLVALSIGAQLAFRTLYAVTNVPYAAWSTRVSDDSRDRTLIAGFRLLFGAAAAAVVALGTPWLLARTGAGGYALVAALFAAIATPLLLIVGIATRQATRIAPAINQASVARNLAALARNRAFVTLGIAMTAAAIAGAILNQSVLYYFRHVAGDPAGGPATFAAMAAAGVLAVPIWTAITVRIGARAAWIIAATLGLAALAIFAVAGPQAIWLARPFLIAMQMVLTGLGLAGWAMLPNTVDYGEARGGLRVEATAFGVSALLQKLALAAAAMLLGGVYTLLGYDGSVAPDAAAREGIRWLMIAAPAAGLVLSIAAMLANPLPRGRHAAIIEELAAGRPA